MATSYPGGIDNLPRPSAGTAMDDSGYEGHVVIDNISDAIEAVQTELGTDPAGSAASVAARLAAIEFRLDALEGSTGGEPWPYGTTYNMDGLANTVIGGPNANDAAYRFRADETSTLNSIRWFQLGPGHGYSTGYTNGDGGDIRISVQTDAGGYPSGTILAYEDHTPGATSENFPLTVFSSPASLTAGTIYHIVFDNIDASPTTNYISIDSTHCYSSYAPSPRQPSMDDAGFAVLLKQGGGSWGIRDHFTWIADLTYGNGVHQGQSYLEVELSNYGRIEGSNYMVRERFTPTTSHVVTGAAARIGRVSGSGDLTLRLENSSGTLIDSATVSAASVPVLAPTANDSAGIWVAGTFSSAQTLSAGQEYRLRLSTDASTSLWTRGIQQGSVAQGFSTALAFSEGYMEATTNGSTWSAITGLSTLGDVQFYLTTQ